MNQQSNLIQKSVLPNGLTIITEQMPHLRSASVGIWVSSGSRHETPELNGISHFIEHALFKGTAKRNARQIAIEGDAIGGNLDAFTSREVACYHFRVLDEQVPRAFDLLTDLVTSPLFDNEELDRERKVVLEEIHMVEDTPDDLVNEVFIANFWPDHPLGRSILGTPETLATFNQDRLMSHFKSVYVPPNLVVAGAGNIEHNSFVDLVAGYMAGIGGTPTSREEIAPSVATPRIILTKDLEQAHLVLGASCPSMLDEDRYAVHLLSVILGGGMSSRLFQTIREEHGLAYSVYQGVNNYTDAGCMFMYAATSPEHMSDAIRLSVDEFRKCKSEPVSEDELQRAKDQLKVSIMLGLESSSARMSNLARQEIYFGRQFSLDEILSKINGVTADDVRRVAGHIFNGNGLALTAIGELGDFKLDEGQLVC